MTKKPTIQVLENPIWEILVPCEMRGRPVRTRHHRVWDKYVVRFSGGLTLLKPGMGRWLSEGVEHIDRVIPVRIACTKEVIEKIAAYTLTHYHQQAVFYYRLGDAFVMSPSPS